MRRKIILKIKLPLTFVSFILCLIIGSLLLPDSIRGSCRINDISLEKVDNFTKFTIYADGPFEFVHSALEEKDGKSYRVIIDCKDAIHNLPQHNFKKDLPTAAIKAIRTSQFQTNPEKIVRIVLDLDQPVIYKVLEKGEDKRGAIAISMAQDPAFPFWAAGKEEKEASKAELTFSAFIEKKSEKRHEAKDNILASPENKNQFYLEQSENAKGEEVKKGMVFEKPLSFADTSETDAKTQVSMVKPGIKKEGVGIKQKALGQTGEEMILAATVASPEILSVSDQKDEKLQSEQVVDKEVGTYGEKETHKNYPPRSFSSPASTDIKKEESSRDSQEWGLPRNSPRHSEEKENVQKEPLLAQKEATPSIGKSEKTAEAAPEENKADSLNLLAREEEVALLAPEEKSTEEKASGTPESLMVIPKPQGTLLEVVPQRKIIHYHGENKRDPFAPLTERIGTELGEIPLPSFESLKLVGVLRDEAGNRALLEDDRGYGYIMKNGDKIKNGYVVSVEDDKVIFQIQEYGWSKTIGLELSN